MSEHGEISISALLKMSDNLVKDFFPSSDIYSLLVLSLITVTKYSREQKRLPTQTRIELAATFIPDLVKHLIKRHIITSDIGDSLLNDYREYEREIPLILKSYIYAGLGLKNKITSTVEKKSRYLCC